MGLKFQQWNRVRAGPFQLKSDQNGIEIKRTCTKHPKITRVKIRPKWDWNLWEFRFLHRNGRLVKIRPKWDWNLYSFIHRFFTFSVKIRPKWDWNSRDISRSSFRSYVLKSDQNGIEIREVHISCHSQFFVRIQPNLKILLEK